VPVVQQDVSLREALVHDLPSYIVGMVFLFVLACLASLVVLVGWLGAPPPLSLSVPAGRMRGVIVRDLYS
jgi:hypothetical protein